jgi:hydrogenase-4 component B
MSATAVSSLYLACLALLALGAAVSLATAKSDRVANWLASVFSCAAAVCGLVASAGVLLSGKVLFLSAGSILPLLTVSLRVDRLSAFFLFTISLIALAASAYGFGYAKHYFGKYNIGKLGFFYNLFILGMILVASAANAFFFLIAWEIMSLASYFLVIYDDRDPANVKAGTLYFIMTHIGTAFITLAFLLLYGSTGSFDFAAIKAGIGAVPAVVQSFVFLLALIGFGTKAGIIPLHIWLPSAHPAAPTHVSALMSGVMIKTGIFMMIRVFIDLMPTPPVWCGIVVLVAGAVSALLGVLYALTEHDIKKLLAYHSIENIGIILLGLGSAMVFVSLGLYPFAILALAAALFHTFNHAVFKSLLFMGAGAVISATGTRNMEEYGGLIKRLPQTAFFFLVGAMAISALPPFNGFFSEWATYQALFSGLMAGSAPIRLAFIFAAGALVFTGGLAAACFVKAFGVTFLARPRSEEAAHAHETSGIQRLAMAVLAVVALGAGVLAVNVMNILSGVAGSLGELGSYAPAFNAAASVFSLKNGFASVSMPLIFIALLVAIVIAFLAVGIFARGARVKLGRTWDCGTELGPRMEMTATGFSRSIITVFRGILKPSKQMTTEYHDAEMRYFAKSKTVKLEVADLYAKYFYRPFRVAVVKVADKVKRIQGGNVNAYVLYIFLTLLVFLGILAVR